MQICEGIDRVAVAVLFPYALIEARRHASTEYRIQDGKCRSAMISHTEDLPPIHNVGLLDGFAYFYAPS